MLRVVLIGVREATGQAIDARVRGATVRVLTESVGIAEEARSSDAVAVLRALPRGLADVEPMLFAGKPVLWSAEAGLSSELLQRLTTLATQTGGRVWVANPQRYLPSRRLIRDQLDSGNLGEPGLIRLQRWETERCPAPTSSLVCDLDLIAWYFGRVPTLVCAVEQRNDESSELFGLQVHLGFSGGGMALLGYSFQVPAGEDYASLSVIGSAGAAYADDQSNRQLLCRGGTSQAVRTDEGVGGMAALVQEFVDQAATSAGGPASNWPEVLAVNEAVFESIRTRQAVRPKELT